MSTEWLNELESIRMLEYYAVVKSIETVLYKVLWSDFQDTLLNGKKKKTIICHLLSKRKGSKKKNVLIFAKRNMGKINQEQMKLFSCRKWMTISWRRRSKAWHFFWIYLLMCSSVEPILIYYILKSKKDGEVTLNGLQIEQKNLTLFPINTI